MKESENIAVIKMILPELNKNQIALLISMGFPININKDYTIDEIDDILESLADMIAASFIDDNHVNEKGILCESIITAITTSPSW